MSAYDDAFKTVMEHEGGGVATSDKDDLGGRTQWGVSERSHPEVWADNKVTEQEAREIFISKYIVWPKLHRIPPSHVKVQTQLIDYGYHSGSGVAVMRLQDALNRLGAHPKLKADGDLGPKTLTALIATDPIKANNLLVAERVKMLGRIVSKNVSQTRFINGWLDRALSFLV